MFNCPRNQKIFLNNWYRFNFIDIFKFLHLNQLNWATDHEGRNQKIIKFVYGIIYECPISLMRIIFAWRKKPIWLNLDWNRQNNKTSLSYITSSRYRNFHEKPEKQFWEEILWSKKYKYTITFSTRILSNIQIQRIFHKIHKNSNFFQ